MKLAALGRRMLGVFLVLLGAPALAADGPTRAGWTTSRFHGTPDPPLPYTVERVFERLEFDRPVLLESTPGSDRLFLGELRGKVWSFRDDPAQADRADLVLDLKALYPPLTALYGLTFHPRFEENRYVYLCYVLRDETLDGSRVARFTMRRTDPPTLDPSSEKLILTFRAGGHNGGCLAFGNDGYLYISTGDGAGPSPPDPLKTGQDVSDLLSSILRIDVDREADGLPYRVPPDNPLIGVPGARPEIWSYGFRNPWKMSFDRRTGDLWVGDVGWELWELIYRVERGGNYGWSVLEGRQPIYPDGLRGPTPILPPTTDHPHSEAASITGGYVYHGRRLQELDGVYIYGDYQSGKVWGLRHDGQRVTDRVELADTGLRLASFGEDRHGELYLVEHERTNGIFRLVPNPDRGRRADFPRTLSQSGLFADTKTFTPAAGVLPYEINAEAWADGTQSERWLAVPGTGRFTIDRRGRLEPLEGTVLAKTVTLELTAGNPRSRRRLETQVLHFEAGSWRPYTYIWNEEQTDAELAPASGGSRSYVVLDERAPDGRREHAHRVAARAECTLCHNPWVDARTTVFGVQSASPLAFTISQLDRDSQLETLERLGYLDGSAAAPGPRLVDPYDPAGDLGERARSYLHVNCSHCHQFNAGGAATILLEAGLRLSETKTVDVRPTQGTFALDDARILAPGRPEQSVLFYRIAKTGGGRMPRVGSQRVDERGLRLIGDWIAGLDPGAGGGAARAGAGVARARRDERDGRRDRGGDPAADRHDDAGAAAGAGDRTGARRARSGRGGRRRDPGAPERRGAGPLRAVPARRPARQAARRLD